MSTLELLGPSRIARIQLPTRSTTPLTLDCVAQVTSAPYFEVVFLPGELPAGELELEGVCRLFFESDGGPHSIMAHIESLINRDRLRLLAQGITVIGRKREFFRVDSQICLDIRYLKPDCDPEVESFSEMVNLSGGGVYFPVTRPLPLHTELLLNLMFDEPFGEIRGVLGEVVRTHESRRGERWIGVKFIKIAPKDRDLIIAFCLAEQRKLLRQRVMTLATPEAG